MSDADLVARLTRAQIVEEWTTPSDSQNQLIALLGEAAAAIERLRAALERIVNVDPETDLGAFYIFAKETAREALAGAEQADPLDPTEGFDR